MPYVNEVFDYWTIVDNTLYELKPHIYAVKCVCKCGVEKYVRISALLTGRSKGCKCRTADRHRELKGNYVGDISDTFWSRIKKSARIRDIDFNITKIYIWELFLKQNKKCKLSNLDIIIEKSICRKRGKSNITASLDRIDSSKGYIVGNVQWLHKDVNYIKQDLDESYFKILCKLITDNDN